MSTGRSATTSVDAAAADDVEQVDAGQPRTDEKNHDAADAERHAEPAAAPPRAS